MNSFYNDLVKVPVNYKKFSEDDDDKLPYPRESILSIIKSINEMESV